MRSLEPAVSVRGLRWQRGGFLLDVPSWDVPAGVVLGLIGANGSGKSSLLRLLPGLDGADRGEVSVLGVNPRKDPVTVRSRLGFMTDTLPVPDMRIDRLLWWLSGFYATWDERLVATLVDRFQLDIGAHANQLSKGQGTRLRLIMAMAFQPRVLVLDEPATGLDLNGRIALLETVLEVMRDPQRTIVLSSHDLADVQRLSDRLTVLSGGVVLADGAMGELVPEGKALADVLVERRWTR